MVFSHFDDICIDLSPLSDLKSKIILSSTDYDEIENVLWFQRIKSPLDEMPSNDAVGVSLLPFKDRYRFTEDNIFPLLWLARSDSMPIMIHLDGIHGDQIVDFFESELVEGVRFILCVPPEWSKDQLIEIDQFINQSIVWDVAHASFSLDDLGSHLRHSVLPPPLEKYIIRRPLAIRPDVDWRLLLGID